MNRYRAVYSTLALLAVMSLIAAVPQQTFAQTEKGNPKTIAERYNLGLSMLEQKKNSEALDLFLEVKQSLDKADRAARPAVPSEYQIQLALGRAHLGLKQYDAAWKNIESARKENGTSSEVYMYRGVCYLEQGKHEEAAKDLEKAISLDANNAYAYYYSGLAYYRMGNGKKAAEDLGTFIKMAPNAPEVEKAEEIRNLC